MEDTEDELMDEAEARRMIPGSNLEAVGKDVMIIPNDFNFLLLEQSYERAPFRFHEGRYEMKEIIDSEEELDNS
jgi:uncharacterized protein YrrD